MKAPTFTGSPQRTDHGDAGPRVLHRVRVLASTWEPPLEWLGFLSLWAGLDVAQYRAKRATQHPPTGEEWPVIEWRHVDLDDLDHWFREAVEQRLGPLPELWLVTHG